MTGLLRPDSAHEKVDVVVVGAGAVGVAAAHELARHGADVIVIEARDRTGAECSYGNAGLVAPSHCIPLAAPHLLRRVPGWLRPGGAVYIKLRPSLSLARFGAELLRSCGRERMLRGLRTLRDLTRASRDLFEDLTRDGLDFGYRRDGVMNVCASSRGFEALREDANLLRREGFDPQVLRPEEAREREPALSPGLAGAVYWAEDGHCDPGRFVAELAGAAERVGARFRLGTRVTGFAHGGDGLVTAVETTGGTLRPRTIVLAAGSWTLPLARLAGTSIPLEPGTGYHVHLVADPPQLRIPLIFQESVLAATPMNGALRLAGTMEFVGFELPAAQGKATRLLEHARTYIDGLGSPGPFETWSGLRPCTPDSLPIVGRSGRVPNLVFATGHAMLGLTLAPVTGKAVADLVVDGRSELPLEPLSPARYRA
jgi:D-amino-acid dehydrogenase